MDIVIFNLRGNITGYQWISSIDGLIGTLRNISLDTLTPGNHTIYFKTKDNDSLWSVADTLNITASGDTLTVSSSVTTGTDTLQVNLTRVADDAGNVIGGRLETLNDIDVSTDEGGEAALAQIENLIQTSIDAASAFGSVQGRIETQTDFVSGLTDALKSGIGTLVDADMEEASARLQALQVQQQLGVQALSIANQAPQQLLSLFR